MPDEYTILTRICNALEPTQPFAKIYANVLLNKVLQTLTPDESHSLFNTHIKHLYKDLPSLALLSKWIHKSEEHSEASQPSISDVEEIQDDDTISIQDSITDWDGSFVKDSAWTANFFKRPLKNRDGNLYPLASVTTMAKTHKIWQRLPEQPLKDVNESFAALSTHHKKHGNQPTSIKKDLDHLKMFYRNMTKSERKKLVQDPQFDVKLTQFYGAVYTEIEEIDFQKNQMATEAELDAAMPWKIIIKRVTAYVNALFSKGLETSSVKELEAATLCSLVVLENGGAPRRLEWFTLSFFPEETQNYYDFEQHQIILSRYKTSGAYGTVSFPVSKNTDLLLRELRDRTSPVSSVFRQKANSSNQFREYFKIVTGKPLWATLLRYLCISEQHLNNQLQFTDERQRLATRMGHSVNQQQKGTYIKRNLLEKWNLDDTNHYDETSDDDTASEVNGRKRKREFTLEEREQLEELWEKHKGNGNEIRNEAIDKGLELQRRTSNNLNKAANRIAANKICDGQELGGFAGIVLEPNIMSEKGIIVDSNTSSGYRKL